MFKVIEWRDVKFEDATLVPPSVTLSESVNVLFELQ